MGSASLAFLPGKMSFESYFRLEGQPEDEQYNRFLLGLAPNYYAKKILSFPGAVNLKEKRGPSTPMACDLCAGVTVTQVLKILLKRGKVLAAPYGMHFDSYTNELKKTWRPWGNNNPLNRIALWFLRRQLKKFNSTGYQVPFLWYDIRGFFIFKLAYRDSLTSLVNFFTKNLSDNHLEVAVGSGSFFNLCLLFNKFIQRKKVKAVAFDYTAEMLAGAKKVLFWNKKVELELADVTKMKYKNNQFKSINVANSFHCFPNPSLAAKEIHRVLKPGGSLAINMLIHPSGMLKSISHHVNEWGKEIKILEAPMSVEETKGLFTEAGFQIKTEKLQGNNLRLLLTK